MDIVKTLLRKQREIENLKKENKWLFDCLNKKENPKILSKIINEFPQENFLKAEGFDEAVIGIEENKKVLIYSISKCLEILENKKNKNKAIQDFQFNIGEIYCGEKAPIWAWDNFK